MLSLFVKHLICSFSTRSQLPGIFAAFSETKTDPDGFFSEPASEAGAGVREEPVRGRAGKEGARQEPQPVGNSGENRQITFLIELNITQFSGHDRF